jgi:hypothetical protein
MLCRRRNNPELEKRRTHHCDFGNCSKVRGEVGRKKRKGKARRNGNIA